MAKNKNSQKFLKVFDKKKDANASCVVFKKVV